MKIRGFEVVSKYTNSEINLPVRKTKYSAGYDIEAAATLVLPPGKVVLVPTGLKAYMQPNEYLGIHVRSGLAVKHSIALINGEGIIDADYYNNPDNEGHIMVAMINQGDMTFTINKGMRIAQGIFYNYLVSDNDTAENERTGGFGSTGK